MGWNLLEWPLESSGRNLESVGMEFYLDSIGIQRNGRFQPFRWILDGVPWNSNIPVGVHRIPPELMGEGKVLSISLPRFILSLPRYISLLFHCLPRSVSFLGWVYLFNIHCLPRSIYFLAWVYFFPCLALFPYYFSTCLGLFLSLWKNEK